MSQNDAIAVAELDNYVLPDVEAPANIDPEARPYEDAPPGWHLMEIVDAKVMPEHVFKSRKEGDCVLDQLRPYFQVAAGEPFAGAQAMDFLPMPTGPMTTMLANRWVSFLHRCGFEVPQGKLAPAGFHPKQLIGRKVLVCIEQTTDSSGNPKTKPNGDPQYGVKLFGYDDPKNKPTKSADPSQQDKTARAPAAQKSPGAAPRNTARQPAAASAASSGDFDL